MTQTWTAERPVIAESRYDKAERRAVVVVQPCRLAYEFSFVRFLRNMPEIIDEHIPATGGTQTFYDYSLPAGATAEYTVLSYAKCGDALFCAPEAAQPVEVTANKHWGRNG